MSVGRQQRHTKNHPCEICGGYDGGKRGQGERCYGFTSDDGMYCFCTREEFATAESPWNESAQAYMHTLLAPPKLVHMRKQDAQPVEDAGAHGKVEAEYVYHDAHGEPLLKVIRYHPKTFRQARWNGTQWLWGIGDLVPVPYRLPRIVEATGDEAVVIVEGEKDADMLAGLGFIATTNPMGAGKWRDEYNEWFRDKTVFIMPDNDEKGYEHGHAVRKALTGIARQIVLVPVAMGIPKGDVSDWLAAGHTDTELEALMMDALNRTQRAKTNITGPLTDEQLAAMEFPPLTWIIPDIVPEGLTLLGGKAKMGKSWMVLAMCIAVANGAVVLGDRRALIGDVLYLALEDNWRRLRERTKRLYENGTKPTGRLTFDILLPRLASGGLAYIEEWCVKHPARRMIVIDTYAKVKDEAKGRNGGGYLDDYASLQGLKEISDAYGVAIVVIHHLRKMDSEDPFDLFSGTTGLTGGVDHMMVLKRVRSENEGVLHIAGREGPDLELALQWEVESATWRIIGDASAYAEKKAGNEIIQLLEESDEALTPRDIAIRLGKDDDKGRGAIRVRLHRMEKAGEVWTANGKYTVAHQTLVTAKTPHNRVTDVTGRSLAHPNAESPVTLPVTLPVTSGGNVTDAKGDTNDMLHPVTPVTRVTSVTPVTSNAQPPKMTAEEVRAAGAARRWPDGTPMTGFRRL